MPFFNAGMQLQQAIEMSSNQIWKVKLSTTTKFLILLGEEKNVQRIIKLCSENEDHTLNEKNIGIVVSDIEFVSLFALFSKIIKCLT